MKQIIPGLWDIDEIGDAVHCYLWEWDGGVTLIDTGMPSHARTILDALMHNNYPLHTVTRVIVTHSDLDHAGGLAKIRRATGASVVCHAVEKELLEHPNRRLLGSALLRASMTLLSPLPAFHQTPVIPQELVVDGDTLPEGFTVIHTPGHTPGHIALLHREKRLLIAGDALANRGGKLQGPASLFTPDGKNAQRSIWKLAKKYGDDYETIVFGHGPAILSNGGKRVKALASQVFAAEI
ncbi:MAG: MBL fold metallo-hydrolase [Chloroflexota bacterium]|nr:MBL fold metallo-hydrolase [Chloroflexota bacterium]